MAEVVFLLAEVVFFPAEVVFLLAEGFFLLRITCLCNLALYSLDLGSHLLGEDGCSVRICALSKQRRTKDMTHRTTKER